LTPKAASDRPNAVQCRICREQCRVQENETKKICGQS
jgi:hypothetical protein